MSLLDIGRSRRALACERSSRPWISDPWVRTSGCRRQSSVISGYSHRPPMVVPVSAARVARPPPPHAPTARRPNV
jgi:hypothetical protein